MPVDYSKWDALELSDDSDVEVHPNVDKKSFIIAKQNQIHAERAARKRQIETLKYERIINDGLLTRISGLLSSLNAHAGDVSSGNANPGEVAFRAMMESAAAAGGKDADTPPFPPDGVHSANESQPTYSKMMASLLDQVNKAVDSKTPKPETGAERYDAMMAEIAEHQSKVKDLQKQLEAKLAELELEQGRKITSEGIKDGFNTSHVAHATAEKSSSGGPSESMQTELLNPGVGGENRVSKATASLDSDEDELEASPDAKKFAKINSSSYQESLAFVSKNPQILSERETDGLLVLAFDAALTNDHDVARQCVHQALLLQYCRALGRDGVALFFKRITTPNHQAQGVFHKDVQDTYHRIRTRAQEINAQRTADGAEGRQSQEGVEQIQLHAVEPGTVINIKIPPVDGERDEQQISGRNIFESFTDSMRAALETGKLDEVNKVLGEMSVDEAEGVVGKLGEAGILSLEEDIIDTTTEEGQKRLEDIRESATGPAAESERTADPE